MFSQADLLFSLANKVYKKQSTKQKYLKSQRLKQFQKIKIKN